MARLLLILCGLFLIGQAAPVADERVFEARDTLAPLHDDDELAQQHLDAIAWEPQTFEVTCAPSDFDDADAVVFFPSPKPSGDEVIDRVAMLWYAARDDEGVVVDAPALVLVHTLHPWMAISKGIARSLSADGIHAFIVQLPGYGYRQAVERQFPGVVAIEHSTQGVGDVRRAADAVAVLPHVAGGPIGLVGTSLGGFVAATVGSLDGRFEPVILVLSGADGAGVLRDGLHDARRLRDRLHLEGYDDDHIARLLDGSEPSYLAHRLNPQKTWLINAGQDMVVPRRSSDLLAERIGLTPDHRVMLNANHYTASLLLPGIVRMISQKVKQSATEAPP